MCLLVPVALFWNFLAITRPITALFLWGASRSQHKPTHSPPPGLLPPPFQAQAEALSTLLGHTALGSWLSSSCGSNGYVLAASALIVPTVLLPSVEALAALGALGVMAAVTVGCVVSE